MLERAKLTLNGGSQQRPAVWLGRHKLQVEQHRATMRPGEASGLRRLLQPGGRGLRFERREKEGERVTPPTLRHQRERALLCLGGHMRGRCPLSRRRGSGLCRVGRGQRERDEEANEHWLSVSQP